MYGSGVYSVDSVKEIKITDEFQNLDQGQKKCQSLHSFEQCVNNQLLGKIRKNCKCIPFELNTFNDSITVKII